MIRLVFFFIGVFLFVSGCTYFILYLNLLTFGYSILDFIKFILFGYPGILLISGLILIVISIFRKGMINR